jgi:ribosomal protein S18 acetylase RimI-like enzyme
MRPLPPEHAIRMTITVRRATPDDAQTIARMVAALGVVTQDPLIDISAADVLRDGFGPEPWFLGFIAERAGAPIGLAVAQRGYATDLGSRGLYITELFVEAEARGRGVGRALMRAVAGQARAFGGEWVAWDVGHENAPAKRFYEKLGARYRDEVVMMVLQGDALEALTNGPMRAGS